MRGGIRGRISFKLRNSRRKGMVGRGMVGRGMVGRCWGGQYKYFSVFEFDDRGGQLGVRELFFVGVEVDEDGFFAFILAVAFNIH